MSDDNTQEKILFWSEAPASWNTLYLDPNGFVCQLTLRADTGQELLPKASAALAKLLRAHGRDSHAENIEAALNEFTDIVAKEVGPQMLSRAMNWVSDEAWGSGEPIPETG